MKKTYLLVGALVVAIAGAGYYVYNKNTETKNKEIHTSSTAKNSENASKSDAANNTAEAEKPGALNPGTYTDYTEEKLASTEGTKLLFFHASWCPQCRELDESIKTSPLPKNTTIFKVDYDSNQALRQRYDVTIQTTVVKLDDSGNKVASYVAYEAPTFANVKAALLQ